nr:CDP-diacylglycerol--glycerol-3-phosphate 3-phosphatidyltransferase [Corynebacterium mendelii]
MPNVLTSIRIVAVPFFAWLVLSGKGTDTGIMWWSLVVFAALMATDKLDGDIARRNNLVTDFGKIADPIADKALMITALVCLNITGRLWPIATVLIVARELGITAWRMVQLNKGHVVPASKGGKLKTVLQSVAVALYLVPFPGWFAPVQAVVMAAAVVVTVVTGVQYIIDSRRSNRR